MYGIHRIHTRTRAYVKRANKTAIDIVIIIVITIHQHQHQHRWQLRFLCNSNVNSAFVCACTVYSMYINIHASRLFYCCNFSFGDWRLGQRVRMSEHDHPHSLDWPTNRSNWATKVKASHFSQKVWKSEKKLQNLTNHSRFIFLLNFAPFNFFHEQTLFSFSSFGKHNNISLII